MREVRAALWGVSAFAVAHVLVAALHLPAFTYDPLARTVSFTAQIRGVSMRYYGDLSWACAAGLCASAVNLHIPLAPRSVGALTAAALSLVVLDVAWYLSPLFAPV